MEDSNCSEPYYFQGLEGGEQKEALSPVMAQQGEPSCNRLIVGTARDYPFTSCFIIILRNILLGSAQKHTCVIIKATEIHSPYVTWKMATSSLSHHVFYLPPRRELLCLQYGKFQERLGLDQFGTQALPLNISVSIISLLPIAL